MAQTDEHELLDYEEDEEPIGGDSDTTSVLPNATVKKSSGHVSIHSCGFRDFLLKPELLRAILDCGFEHPRYFFINYILWFNGYFKSSAT